MVVNGTSQNQSLEQQIKGKTYTGIRREFFIVPQKSGALRLSENEIILTPAYTDEKQTVMVSASPIEVRIPAGAGDLSSFLPGSGIQLTDSLDPASLTDLKVGDAITRKVSLEVDGILASLIPAIDAGMTPQGLELYAGTPEVMAVTTDRRGFVGGRRIETFNYLAHEEGRYTLPAIKVRWWNTEADRFEEETIPPVSFEIAAASNTGAEAALQQGISDKLLDNLGIIVLMLIIFTLALLLFARYQREIKHFSQSLCLKIKIWIYQTMTSEPMYFHRMMWAMRFSSHEPSMFFYHKWLQARGGMEEALPSEIAIWLGKNYSSGHEIISSADVIESLKKSRKAYKQSLKPKYSRYGLPALNH